MTAAEFADRFSLTETDVAALCERHSVEADDLDGIPDQKRPVVWVSYGPDDSDVEPLNCVDA